MAYGRRALNGSLTPVISSVTFLLWNSRRLAWLSFCSRFPVTITGCARNVSESWQEEEGAKNVSLFLSSGLPSSYFAQLTSLITLAVFNLCATLTHPFPVTFAHLRLPGHKCLYSVSYFLPEIQEGVVRICLLR